MKAYWFDNLEGDQRLPHDSGRPVDPAYLSALGVTHYYLPDDLDSVNKIASERNYKNRDEIEISPTLLPNYEEKVKTFFHEHLHEDEEIRYILAGGGYFDVRSKDDAWVRLRLEKGDLMIMPAGIYHRFTTDDQNVSCLPPPCVSLGIGGCCGIVAYNADVGDTVYQGHAPFQGRPQVDAAAAWRGDGFQPLPQGLLADYHRRHQRLIRPSADEVWLALVYTLSHVCVIDEKSGGALSE
jgi:1,2-dihydroxy-3-keto-5-methylthiopentene dioxygenase